MPRYEREGEYREVSLDGTTLVTVTGKPGGFFRRKLSETREKTTFDSSRDARLAFAKLTRELRDEGFVCIADKARKKSSTDAVATATRVKFESFLEIEIPEPFTAVRAKEALAGLYELRRALEASSQGAFFPRRRDLLIGLDPEPRIRAWEARVEEHYGGPLSLIELDTRGRHEESFLSAALPADFGDVEDFRAQRAISALYALRETIARSRAGEFFPDAPHILDGLDPEPLLEAWRAKLTEHHGEVGRAFFAEVAADHGVVIADVELRTGRRRQTLRPAPAPRSERGIDRSPGGDGERDQALLTLGERLLSNRDDREAYAVYADRLQELGSRFGELIALSMAAEASGDDSARKRFLRAHGSEVLGRLAEISQQGVELTWRHGFIEKARFADTDNDELYEGIEGLLECPAGSLCAELTLGMMGDSELDYGAAIELIAESGPHRALRSLFLGDFEYPDEIEMSWAVVGDVGELWKACSSLRELTLQGSDIELGDIEAGSLRRLSLRTGGLPVAALRSVAAADWPELVELELWLGDGHYGGEAEIGDIVPLLHGERMPKLETLRLMNAELSDDIVRALAGSALLPRLRIVDLSMGTLSLDGARAIIANIAAFERLEGLELSDNCLSPEACALLARYPFVSCDSQKDDDGGEHRYPTVGE